MPDTCSNCGHGISQNARFCRHCGASQIAETEKTIAQTQQYGHAVPRRYATPETPSPGWLYESQAPDTSRIDKSQNAVYTVPNPTGSPAKFWFFISLLCVLLIAGVAASSFFAARNSRRPVQANWEDPAVEEMKSQAEQAHKDAEQMVKDMEKAARDAEQAAKDASKILVPPAPPVPPTGPVPSLTSPKGPGPAGPIFDDLIYPGATITKRVGGPEGTFVVTMHTDHSLRQVQDYYSKKMGKPMAASNEGASFVQRRKDGQTLVKLSDDGHVEIVVVRTMARD